MAGRPQVSDFDLRDAPQLQPFLLPNVRPTGRTLGGGAYGTVEELDVRGRTPLCGEETTRRPRRTGELWRTQHREEVRGGMLASPAPTSVTLTLSNSLASVS